MVRGKFTLIKSTELSFSKTIRILEFTAVSNDNTEENTKFHKYTPSGTITMTVDNPAALDKFALGSAYYVDFTPVN